jgi:hypothetical protein
VYVYTNIYIHVYIERERERDPRAMGLSSKAKSVTPIANTDNAYHYVSAFRIWVKGSALGFRV